ncbi:hydroxymethylbilane synthase [Sinomicrobium soli]|uniref:hydroxymethylbilane synthase n=1 Tax=Sinomicrobium sp. N-1-3-6 TaxID=2219864 RepID=UPI000DCEF6D0|nr:hydroxymethylbilane synthase [Sinomicrobium sp. N-1-3-6]RAV28337.1 hydroxymethylbilane synthase [Sinomicrobium sp. N-1-3-6]
MKKTLRIGTRDSELALWQANRVKEGLESLEYQAEIVPVKSHGDLVLDKPLYEMGITGIFTKALDIAMIRGEIDIAVHSMKDVPTALPRGIVQGAVLKRADASDLLIHKGDLAFLDEAGTVATGSLRRRAQWLHRYPEHSVENLRGNINTRMRKLQNSSWNGAIFAAAGLERISPFEGTDIDPGNRITLDWMVPAPAQGAMLAVAMEHDDYGRQALDRLNHRDTEICTHVERQFLRVLEGGCTAPIGAKACLENDDIVFNGILLSPDGKRKHSVQKRAPLKQYTVLGEQCALEILKNGGKETLEHIRQYQDQRPGTTASS